MSGRDSWRRGRSAESLCVLSLRLRGYSILARRFASGRGTGAGEVDIVARRGHVLAFVEVKARPEARIAVEAIGPRQQARIRRGAESFLKRHPALAGCLVRFDVMAVAPWRWPHHLIDAWR